MSGLGGNGIKGNGIKGNGIKGQGIGGNGVRGNGINGNGIAGNGMDQHRRGHNNGFGHFGGILGNRGINPRTNEAFTFVGEVDSWGDVKNSSAKEKKQSKYPIFSPILEIHDKMQVLHSTGSGFVAQSTLDVLESEFAMMKIYCFQISVSAIVWVLIKLLVLFVIACAWSFYLGDRFSQGLVYVPVMFAFTWIPSIFYRYFLCSMKQFVIFGERVPRTSRFYNSVKNILKPAEILGFLITILLVVLQLSFVKWSKYITILLEKLPNAMQSERLLDLERWHYVILNMSIAWGFAFGFYVILTYALRNKFDKLQKVNMRNILIQHNRAVATDTILRGEI